MSDVLSEPWRKRLGLEGASGWMLAALFGVYVVAVTGWSYNIPTGSNTPFGAIWLGLSIAALLLASLFVAGLRPSRRVLRPVEALAILALVAMVLTDVTMAWQPLRDLAIYLRAGRDYLQGSPVYLQTPLAIQPVDRSQYPFLYPPCTLPLFGLLASQPLWLAQAAWVTSSALLGLAALRIIGLPWRWLVPALLWPPLFQGLWVGNVAVPALALFALGPWLGGTLVLGGLFKPYTTLASLWLIRERRWAALMAGIGSVLLLAAITLPLTGLDLWSQWLGGLQAYQKSQDLLPGLYGFGLGRYVPFAAFAVLALAALVLALRMGGRDALAQLGTATVVASPSLFGHGLLLAVASMLSMRTFWLWLAIGLLSSPDGAQWWLAVGLVVASWLIPALRLSADEEVERRSRAHSFLEANAGAWPGLQRSRLPVRSESKPAMPVLVADRPELATSESGSVLPES